MNKITNSINDDLKKDLPSFRSGDTIEVDTVDGPTTLQIPSGTQPNAILMLDNKGIPKLGNPVARGNQKISVIVKSGFASKTLTSNVKLLSSSASSSISLSGSILTIIV